jgi:hypothetical protein
MGWEERREKKSGAKGAGSRDKEGRRKRSVKTNETKRRGIMP